MNGRPLPPYARIIRAARRAGDLRGWWGTSADGMNPSLWLCVGSDAWYIARTWSASRLVTLHPSGEDPAAFDWSDLADADPVLLHRCGRVDGDELRRLVWAVLRDGADRVWCMTSGMMYTAEVQRAVS